MKNVFPIFIVVVALALLARSAMPQKNETPFDLRGFSELPVLANGRVKPIDTVARTSLLRIQRGGAVKSTTGEKLVGTPTEWLLEVAFRPERADTLPVFHIDHPEILSLIGKSEEDLKIAYEGFSKKLRSVMGSLPSRRKTFSLVELRPHFAAIDEQAKLARPVESALRTSFQRAILELHGNLVHYQQLQHAFVAPGRKDFLNDLLTFQDNIVAGRAAVIAKMNNQPHDEAAAAAVIDISEHFATMSESANVLVVPPDVGDPDPNAWRSAGAALLETFRTGRVNPTALAYAGFAQAWRNDQPEQFNKLVELFRADVAQRLGPQIGKAEAETRFNGARIFTRARALYGLAFVLAIVSWLRWPLALGRAAFALIAIAWVASTIGIGMRMWLEGRPPVTNLYSSALFVGWAAVGLCLVLEFIFKNTLATVAAGVIGFATLTIAHYLSFDGDTMEMMRAVLDSNFWLTTHVPTVALGYSATFLAGFLGAIYIVLGVFTRLLDRTAADALARMVYGIVCFATLFSFTGTVLGGIWADQSWGRFWGWDPKENGALIIVIWNAMILHARWGGMIKQRGLMGMAVFGNIVTSWSWFGTNMLGIGLHSYGFTDTGFVALTCFMLSQVVLIVISCTSLDRWRSFRAEPAALEKPAPAPTTSG